MEDRERFERTEQGSREGLDEAGEYKGIARHPKARAWLRRTLREARAEGDEAKAEKTALVMRRCGMGVRT